MRLLTADDDPNTLNLLKKYLNQWNYGVVTATNGLDALEILKGKDPPQIVILDWLMPGMDGIEVIRKARELTFDSPPYMILFTVRDEKGAIIEGLDAGANDYVTKPFDKDEFHARIRVGERVIQLQNALSERIRELQDAMAQIKRLRGIIPICSYCHKIRNDQKSWEGLEKYIIEHSEAEFSHGICPDCAKKYFSKYSK